MRHLSHPRSHPHTQGSCQTWSFSLSGPKKQGASDVRPPVPIEPCAPLSRDTACAISLHDAMNCLVIPGAAGSFGNGRLYVSLLSQRVSPSTGPIRSHRMVLLYRNVKETASSHWPIVIGIGKDALEGIRLHGVASCTRFGSVRDLQGCLSPQRREVSRLCLQSPRRPFGPAPIP